MHLCYTLQENVDTVTTVHVLTHPAAAAAAGAPLLLVPTTLQVQLQVQGA
jgi:hypothetical protein